MYLRTGVDTGTTAIAATADVHSHLPLHRRPPLSAITENPIYKILTEPLC